MGYGGRVQPIHFFRRRVLDLKQYEDLQALFAAMNKDQRDLRRAVHNTMWHMRGSLSREEAWTLSPIERHDIDRLVKERMDIVQKTGLALI
jgi:hypothetical protein